MFGGFAHNAGQPQGAVPIVIRLSLFAKEGVLADRKMRLLVDGLLRAAAEPAGQPLHGTKASPGLFADGAAAKQMAQYCKEAGLVQILRTEKKGKTTHEICTITEKGIAYLVSELSPKAVLEEFVRAVEARRRQVEEVVEVARHCQATFAALKTQVERVLTQVKPAVPLPSTTVPPHSNGPGPWKTDVLTYLTHWPASHPNEDCPLPELYQQARQTAPALTIGQYHDGLRQMHEQGQVYLHPWTGPLYEIPQPAYALLVGHAVAYYASRKS